MTKKLSLISENPEFLDLLDEFLGKQPRILLANEGLWRVSLDFAKDLARYMRRRDVIIENLGSVLMYTFWEKIVGLGV